MSCYLLYKCVKHGIKEKIVYFSIYIEERLSIHFYLFYLFPSLLNKNMFYFLKISSYAMNTGLNL